MNDKPSVARQVFMTVAIALAVLVATMGLAMIALVVLVVSNANSFGSNK